MLHTSIDKLILVFLIIFMSHVYSIGQDNSSFDMSVEFQAYPTGLIPGVRFEKLVGEKESVHLRIGYNWIRHRDLGVHDDERGDGYGFTLGYKRYFKSGHTGWHIGIRSDYWRNTIDWMDDPNLSGTTKITVIQPTAELGYHFDINENFHWTPSVAFGWEWNAKTDGEPTGEGAILLIGVQVGKRF